MIYIYPRSNPADIAITVISETIRSLFHPKRFPFISLLFKRWTPASRSNGLAYSLSLYTIPMRIPRDLPDNTFCSAVRRDTKD